tara:strand:- start:24714 stop:25832 length:1119 start_codon:yes stop_codon:yes gene_type:complete
VSLSVCHISTVHSAFDDRIFYKECVSLSKAGYEVTLVINHDKDERVKGVNIKALKPTSSRLKRIFIKPFKAAFKVLKSKPKVIHLHDPELLPLGVLFAVLGKKVVYDMHELVYHQIADKSWIGFPLVRKLISKVYFFIEKISITLFSRVILAEDGYKHYVTSHYANQINKFEYVRNFSILSLIEKINPVNKVTNNKIVIYAGGLTVIRGIKEVIQAVNKLDGVELWLLGSWENERYQKESMNEDKNNVVNYIGQVRMEDVYAYMKVADIGIANLYHLENYLTSLPVKAFEYMACRLPIIMSDFPFWKNVFSECALFVDPKNPTEISEKIKYLISRPELAQIMADKSYKLVYEKYSWEQESNKLVELYQKMLN